MELFGPCAREYGHGHNYVLEVTLRGGVDPDTGIIVNLTEVRDAVRSLIIDKVDHRHLSTASRRSAPASIQRRRILPCYSGTH